MEKKEDPKAPAQRAGGIARAAALTDNRKREIASVAALARWGAKATHRGSFKEQFGIDVDCYVLDDAAKTAVVSQRGMALVLGLSERGNAFHRFLASKGMMKHAGAPLQDKAQRPLKFQWVGGAQQPPFEVHGYDVGLLIDVCKAIIAADKEGDLTHNQKGVAKQANIILNASAKSGIRHLVYALAGYDATRQEIIDAFKLYVREEAREYEREFPEQLYAEWYRLYQLPKPERNKPWKFKHLTIEHVYTPLARSNGKVLQLTQASRASSSEPRRKLHQFLSEIGVKALRTQLGQVLGIAQVSDSQEQYEKHIGRVFGIQKRLFE